MALTRTTRPTLHTLLQPSKPPFTLIQCACLHNHIAPGRIPPPTPFVPDPQTFLTLIGRKLSTHSAKIPTWESLFSLTSPQLRSLGIEPARTRRYLLHQREKFRNGHFGIGGDLTDVVDGVGEIRVVEVPTAGKRAGSATRTPDTKRVVLNVPAGAEVPSRPLSECSPVSFVKVKGAGTIVGRSVQAVKGEGGKVARIRVQEGLWEVRRGVKVDGGERRKAEVRAKRSVEERRKARV